LAEVLGSVGGWLGCQRWLGSHAGLLAVVGSIDAGATPIAAGKGCCWTWGAYHTCGGAGGYYRWLNWVAYGGWWWAIVEATTWSTIVRARGRGRKMRASY